MRASSHAADVPVGEAYVQRQPAEEVRADEQTGAIGPCEKAVWRGIERGDPGPERAARVEPLGFTRRSSEADST